MGGARELTSSALILHFKSTHIDLTLQLRLPFQKNAILSKKGFIIWKPYNCRHVVLEHTQHYKKGQCTYKIEPAVVLQIGEGVDQVMQVKGASTYRAGQERGEKGKKKEKLH